MEATVTEVDGKTTRTLPGLSGRTLTIGEWNNPTGKYKLGLKRSTDIFPKPLVDRLQKDRKNKFEIAHQHLVTKIHRELEDLEKSQPKEDKDEYEKLKADYKTRLEVLKEQWKSYEDPGLLIDCLVFHDGEKWRAAVDMNESGDLTNAQLLTNYADEQQFVRWSDDSLLNFSVNIYDEGETLSIVTLAGSHGTHVAAISAAHYPDDPQLNGVAPGAQIISLKIGDTRLGMSGIMYPMKGTLTYFAYRINGNWHRSRPCRNRTSPPKTRPGEHLIRRSSLYSKHRPIRRTPA